MSPLSTDFDPRALTPGPRYPGHARRQGLAQIQRGAREEGRAGHRPLGAGGLGEGAEEGQRGQGRGSRTPTITRSPSWGSSRSSTQAPLPHALMVMKAFIYNIFIAQIRALPREAGRGRGRWAARRGVVQHSTYFQCAARPRRSRSARRDREGPPLKAPVHGMDPAGAFWKSPRPGLGALAPSGGHSGPGTNPFRRTAPHFLAVTLIVATILSGSILSSRSWLPVRFVHASTSGLNP